MIIMQSSRKTSNRKPAEKTPDEPKKNEEKQRTAFTLSTPRSHPPKSTADIYSQKKISTPRMASNITARNTLKTKDTTDKLNAPKTSRVSGKDRSKVTPKAVTESQPKSSDKVSQRSISSNTIGSKSLADRSKSIKTTTDKYKLNKSTTDSSKQSNFSKSHTELKSTMKVGTPRTAKDLPFVNLLVNSPPTERKIINLTSEINVKHSSLSSERQERRAETEHGLTVASERDEDGKSRYRGKTRTLNDSEVKILTQEGVDNNFEMRKLTQKLTAKPRAFYIDFDDGKSAKSKNLAEGSVDTPDETGDDSYEDDFDSYESDFDSYQSEADSSGSDHKLKYSDDVTKPGNDSDTSIQNNVTNPKMVVDEEKMLDSGSFDLREAQKSATKVKPGMVDIKEDKELGADYSKKQSSLTDEGFLEMISSSAGSSMRTMEKGDSIDRPTFIDFTKAKENRKKRLIRERQKQRAADILSMISLHQVSYILFDIKPITYDRFMVIYGSINGNQASTQTYDDGVTEEIQTEDVEMKTKWTQHPVDFSRHEVHVTKLVKINNIDYTSKFQVILNCKEENNYYDGYKDDPLRIYLDQRSGVGPDSVISNGNYEKLVKKPHFNSDRLKKFLTKTEKKLNRILKSGIIEAAMKSSKWPFSNGYKNLFENAESHSNLFFLHNKPAYKVVFSENNENLILTLHRKVHLKPDEIEKYSFNEAFLKKCVICVWDLSVAVNNVPLKILVAVDDIAMCSFKGDENGLVVAALNDGSIHIWDLSEQDSYHCEFVSPRIEQGQMITEQDVKRTSTEQDRQWNYENNSNTDSRESQTVRSCAYTNSALSIADGFHRELEDRIVGLEFVPVDAANSQGRRKLLGQICALQRHGLLTFYAIVQDNLDHSKDIGKAYWSKIKLQKVNMINVSQELERPLQETCSGDQNFNLAAAKRRISKKSNVRNTKFKQKTPSKSIENDDFDSWDGVASATENETVERSVASSDVLPRDNWESGVVCTHLKVMCADKTQKLLVARNCGEVLCVSRGSGAVRVRRYRIETAASTITTLSPSPGRALFLAGSDSGRVHLYSVTEERTLLSLDCRNHARTAEKRVQSDMQGRYPVSVAVKPPACGDGEDSVEVAVKSVHWFADNPCSLLVLSQNGALCLWDLTRSDIATRWRTEVAHDGHAVCDTALGCGGRRAKLAVLTSEGMVEIHQVSTSSQGHAGLEELFQRYVSLL